MCTLLTFVISYDCFACMFRGSLLRCRVVLTVLSRRSRSVHFVDRSIDRCPDESTARRVTRSPSAWTSEVACACAPARRVTYADARAIGARSDDGTGHDDRLVSRQSISRHDTSLWSITVTHGARTDAPGAIISAHRPDTTGQELIASLCRTRTNEGRVMPTPAAADQFSNAHSHFSLLTAPSRINLIRRLHHPIDPSSPR
jgi:hypothetical protein